MMCQRIGRPPISIIGFGRSTDSSLMREPIPPASKTTFMMNDVLTPEAVCSRATVRRMHRSCHSPELSASIRRQPIHDLLGRVVDESLAVPELLEPPLEDVAQLRLLVDAQLLFGVK